MNRRAFVTTVTAGYAGMYTACGTPGDTRLQAMVTILPLRYFVERVGGGRVRVTVLAGPGQNPATYEPLPRQLLELTTADVLFRTGVPFEEALVPRLAENAPGLTVVDLRNGIELYPMDTLATIGELHDDGHAHGHDGAQESHDHTGHDPHIWLSPALVRVQAATIRDALIAADPHHEAEYRENWAAFDHDLAAESDEIRAMTGQLENPAMLVFHPAWGYFAREFGLRQIPIEIEGREPGPRELAAVIDYARNRHIRVVFVQAQFSTASAEAIARAIDGTVVAIDPLSDDYLNNLRRIAEAITDALGKDMP
ncbi:ABC transporter substrate-binding protein [bacterium]|nr:ABC transporter substrate-binding protein [bacterium]